MDTPNRDFLPTVLLFAWSKLAEPAGHILREVGFRKLNALFSLLGLTLAVTIVAASQLLAEADERETRRVTRDMGFNLRLIPSKTDLGQFYRDGFSRHAMEATTLDRLATQLTNNVSFNHLVGSLRRDYTINGQNILLVGLSKTFVAPGQGKKPMGFEIKEGTIHIGSEIARWQELKKGDAMHVGVRRFTVANDPIETGTPVVATNDVRYAQPEDYRRYDLLTCIRLGITVHDPHTSRPTNAEAYLKTGPTARHVGGRPSPCQRQRRSHQGTIFGPLGCSGKKRGDPDSHDGLGYPGFHHENLGPKRHGWRHSSRANPMGHVGQADHRDRLPGRYRHERRISRTPTKRR